MWCRYNMHHVPHSYVSWLSISIPDIKVLPFERRFFKHHEFVCLPKCELWPCLTSFCPLLADRELFISWMFGFCHRHCNCNMHGMGKKQLRWEKEKKVVPLVEQSQEILAWLGKLSYQWNSECIGWGSVYWSLCNSSYSLWCPLWPPKVVPKEADIGDLLVLLAQAHPHDLQISFVLKNEMCKQLRYLKAEKYRPFHLQILTCSHRSLDSSGRGRTSTSCWASASSQTWPSIVEDEDDGNHNCVDGEYEKI